MTQAYVDPMVSVRISILSIFLAMGLGFVMVMTDPNLHARAERFFHADSERTEAVYRTLGTLTRAILEGGPRKEKKQI